MKDETQSGGVMPVPSALDRLCRFALYTRSSDIPKAAAQRAALLLLDTLGICAASAPMKAGRIGRDTAAMLFGAGAHTGARMLFDGRRVSLAGAVYAAATQTDNLDAHDGYNPTKGHIGVVTAPTLAALAEGRGLSGAEALAALVIGYEVAGRAGIALHATACDYHTSGAWNALGVVAMAARLRGLTEAQLAHALGIAEYHGPRSQMMREIANPTMLHDGSGWGALAGMSAAVLAEQGFTGAPAVTVTGPEVGEVWADLGRVWQTELQYIKPYPICRWAHAAIEAAAGLAHAHVVEANDVAGIEIATFTSAAALFAGMPATTSEAQYSLPFAVAAMLVHGRIGLPEISSAGLRDAQVSRLVQATTVHVAPAFDARFPQERWADVTLQLMDGRRVTSGPTQTRGGPEAPLSADEIVAKYHAYADPVLGSERAERLRDAVLALPRGGDFAAVADHLYAPVQTVNGDTHET